MMEDVDPVRCRFWRLVMAAMESAATAAAVVVNVVVQRSAIT